MLIQRFGRVAVARAGGALIAVGGVVVVTAVDQPVVLFTGFAFIGYGSATLVPSALSAASALPGVSEGAGVTFVSWSMRCGFLVTSPFIGGVADLADLRWGLMILVVIGLTVLLLARALQAGRVSDSRARVNGDRGSDG
jgi:MFS family permease